MIKAAIRPQAQKRKTIRADAPIKSARDGVFVPKNDKINAYFDQNNQNND